ncbi:MAG: hypothetical protein WC905_05020 [Patescibacteria group bacterium]|jgi:hypothetical protein
MKVAFNTFVTDANIVHNKKYKYIEQDYRGVSQKITIICPIHGIFHQRGSDHLKGCGCNLCGRHQTSIKNRLSRNEFLEKCKKIHDDTYDYSKVDYINSTTKVAIICKVHGEFTQDPAMHLQGVGCPECAHIKRKDGLTEDLDEFTKKAKIIHNNMYEYVKLYYINDIRFVDVICKTHGLFTQNSSNHIQGSICPKCSNNGTSSLEKIIYEFLDVLNVEYYYRKRIIFNGKWSEVDLFIPNKNIAFEINGRYWHSELAGKDRNYHINKTLICEKLGIRLIHIMEDEFKNLDLLKSRIQNILRPDLNIRIYARKCQIREIKDKKQKSEFLKINHKQGNDNSQICYGLYYNDILVSIMTFSKQRKCFGYKNINGWEMVRFCSLIYHNVIGAASKLIRHFENDYNPNNIITFADRCWSDGNLYKKLGFVLSHISKPSYWYFNGQSGIYHRFSFRKGTLSKKLTTFDPLLSEWENMKNNGYNRFWDCGNFVFEKIYTKS